MNFFIWTANKWSKCLVLASCTGTYIVLSLNLSSWRTSPAVLKTLILCCLSISNIWGSVSIRRLGFWILIFSSWDWKILTAAPNWFCSLSYYSSILLLFNLNSTFYLNLDPYKLKIKLSKVLSIYSVVNPSELLILSNCLNSWTNWLLFFLFSGSCW